MIISATELKMNLNKYLTLAKQEDIFITQYGKTIAKLINPYKEKVEIVEALAGSVNASKSFEDVKEERIKEL